MPREVRVWYEVYLCTGYCVEGDEQTGLYKYSSVHFFSTNKRAYMYGYKREWRYIRPVEFGLKSDPGIIGSFTIYKYNVLVRSPVENVGWVHGPDRLIELKS